MSQRSRNQSCLRIHLLFREVVLQNEEWTVLSDPDEYLPWFPEKE